MLKAYKIIYIGLVQGVGFRPFIARIAFKSRVKGYVRNLGGGEVEIFIEGKEKEIKNFLKLFKENLPPTAFIKKIKIKKEKFIGYKDFKILKSSKEFFLRSEIPPDFSFCKDCLEEILNKKTRWYNYAFNSCAWCGPRFSLIEDLPYDRENTSWKDFPLCKDCLEEYKDINNIRRYHAQGISCKNCGPKVFLKDYEEKILEGYEAIKEASKLINEGYILAIKGIGGFHLACLATDDEVVLKLRKRKKREKQPFAIMCLNLKIAEKLVQINNFSKKHFEGFIRSIIILPKKENTKVSKYVAPNLNTLGIMTAYTPLHFLILKNLEDKFSIMTSGNLTGEPMVISNEEALKKLKGIADYFLMHDRKIMNRVDDSVLRFTLNKPIIIRRARGYSSRWINIKENLSKSVIAFGADLQSSGAIGFENKIVSTQYIGDVDEISTLLDLQKYLLRIIKMYKLSISNSLLIADMHPLYASTNVAEKWKNEYGGNLIKLQHHYCHFSSSLIDNLHDLNEPAIGITLDGAGYGLDEAIWGGEILVYEQNKIYRIGHLEYHLMPGGDLATYYPLRMLVSILRKKLSENEVIKIFEENKLTKNFKYGEKELYFCLKSIKNNKGPKTSSTGRFLDSVSSLLKICFKRTYEGEPAIKLEDYALKGKLIKIEEIDLINNNDEIIIPTSDLILKILNFLKNEKKENIAYTVQYKLGNLIGEAVNLIANKKGINYVYISGGAAVNDHICKGIKNSLDRNIKFKLHKRIPPNDGGIAIGQIYLAKILGYV